MKQEDPKVGELWVKEAKVKNSEVLKSNEKLERMHEYGWDLNTTFFSH